MVARVEMKEKEAKQSLCDKVEKNGDKREAKERNGNQTNSEKENKEID